MVNGKLHVTDMTFFARKTGSLRARYREWDKETPTDIALPSDENLLFLVLKRLRQSICIASYLLDDASLMQYASSEQRKKLHRVLSRLQFSCEVCGDPTRIHFKDTEGWTHLYCQACYLECVCGNPILNSIKEHPGYNIGNDNVLRSDFTYHGHGVLEDFN